MTTQIMREETRCRHMGYSFRLTSRVLLYAPPNRQNSTYHGLCYTSRGALAGTRNLRHKDTLLHQLWLVRTIIQLFGMKFRIRGKLGKLEIKPFALRQAISIYCGLKLNVCAYIHLRLQHAILGSYLSKLVVCY